MSILDYKFVQRAFLVDILLTTTVPCIGIAVVLKCLSMMGDALSHTSLAGVAAGLVLGINPILGTVTACIAAALGVEVIHKRIPKYPGLSIIIILSAKVGLAGVLSSSVKSAVDFNSSLFGSIVTISGFELILVCCISAAVPVCFLVLYQELFLVTLDECTTRLAGVPTGIVNFTSAILTAVTVSVVARTVGTLITSSLMAIPVTCTMQVARGYRQTMLWSVVFALLFTVSGLLPSYYAWLRPGATIALIDVVVLVVILLAGNLFGARGHAGA